MSLTQDLDDRAVTTALPPPAEAVAKAPLKVGYLVMNVRDAAVNRRIEMLRIGGAQVEVAGFSRVADTIVPALGSRTTILGLTEDTKLIRRVGTILRTALRLRSWQHVVADASVIVTRNLEMLVLARWARWRLKIDAPIVYESLDVHRLLVSDGIAGRIVRAIERNCLRACSALMVSSPAFLRAHFAARYRELPRVMLMENKVLESELSAGEAPPAKAPPPPLRIGWFGLLRCRRSLGILAQLARNNPGRVEIILRGRPILPEIPDFMEIVAATPGLTYEGPYDRSRDLPRIYGEVDLVWSLDFFDAGANSSWLLPNRLYEGALYGAIPIGDRAVETGRWLAERKVGVLIERPFDEALQRMLDELDADRLAELRAGFAALPREHFLMSLEDIRGFVEDLRQQAEGAAIGRP